MKLISNEAEQPEKRLTKRRGVTLGMVLLVVAVLGLVSAGAVYAVRMSRQAERRQQLETDVASVNVAVRKFLAKGGCFKVSFTEQEVLDRLQDGMPGVEATLANQAGRVTACASNGKQIDVKAVWNPLLNRFYVSETTNEGVGEFRLQSAKGKSMGLTPAMAGTPSGENLPTSTSHRSGWTPPTATALGQLAPPVYSVAGGLFEHSQFPFNVFLNNPNPAGAARIMVSVNGQPWKTYAGGALKVEKALTTSIQTYACPLSETEWRASEPVQEQYRTIFFNGSTAAYFHQAAGDKDLKTNLSANRNAPRFEWGEPAADRREPNWIEFRGAAVDALPDQEFVLGQISYFNSTTYSGTNASSVHMECRLNLKDLPNAGAADFVVSFASTPNRPGQTADEAADVVRLAEMSATLPQPIQGKYFRLSIRMGRCEKDGYSTSNELHGHEDCVSSVLIYGKLSALAGAQ